MFQDCLHLTPDGDAGDKGTDGETSSEDSKKLSRKILDVYEKIKLTLQQHQTQEEEKSLA